MLFYGQSGVGKSSILDAGLIPRLERDYEVRYLRRTEGGLLDTLQLAFLQEASDVSIETAWRMSEERSGKPLIVFLDQVEELYTRPIADLSDELDQLLHAVKATFGDPKNRPKGKLVLGFRKEWLAELESQLVEFELPRTKVFLEPLDRRGIIEVVQGPSSSKRMRERYGLTIEDGLAEIIADDLLEDRVSAIAPTLQILLTKLWNKAIDANYEQPKFNQDLYQQLKRDGILLRDFLNQQITAFRERYPDAVDSGLLLDIIALHTTPLGTAGQCTIEQLQEQYVHLGALLPDVLQQCQDLYLLTLASSDQKNSNETTRLAHDTLAPIVREQFDSSDKPGQRARRILDNRSVGWSENRESTPLDEADLIVVERGVTGTRTLNSAEQRLLERSLELRDRSQRNRKCLKIVGALASVVIVGLGVWGWLNFNQAEAARKNLDATNTALTLTNRDLATTTEGLKEKTNEANRSKRKAEANLQTAKHSVEDLLDLFTELPRRAGEVAAAMTAADAQTAFEAIERYGMPSSRRITSAGIEKAVEELDSRLTIWRDYSGPLNELHDEHPAKECRDAVLNLVRVTADEWKEQSSSELLTRSTQSKLRNERREFERDIITQGLCQRAINVTLAIAEAASEGRESMLTFRSEFERLYWAELYWVELGQDGESSLEAAMVAFRDTGLQNWRLDDVSKSDLTTLARTVRDCCELLISHPTIERTQLK
nr:hypothetical protein [Allorhodopirellula solitaria]